MATRFALLSLYLGASVTLYSLPEEGVASSGKMEVVQKSDLMQITTNDRAILNWDSFSIGKTETLQFLQPSHHSAVLNRVIGLDASKLDGTLQANGHVFLINPNGLIIGKDAVINTAGFMGTTLQISDADFLNNTELLFQGDSTAPIVNLGTLQTSQGPVTLMAHKIDNQGQITSNEKVSLIAGHEILLTSSHEILHIRPDIKAEGIESSGVIQILQTRIENEGVSSLAIRQVDEPNATKMVTEGGKILFRAEGGPTSVSGELTAAGGSIHVLGETVHIQDGATIDVSAPYGGGEILIGGDYQGKNPNVPNAVMTLVDKNTSLKADATVNGNGGKVIIWGNESTEAFGPISARGGDFGGDGGFVEVSGKYLNFTGITDRRAPYGKWGTLLLDPSAIVINAVSDTNITFTASVAGGTYAPTAAGDSTILNTNIVTNLENGYVTITNAAGAGGTSGTITQMAGAPISWDVPTGLTIHATQNIDIQDVLRNTSAQTGFTAITLINDATDPGEYAGITIESTAALQTVGGDISLTGLGNGTVSSNTAYGVNVAFGSQITSSLGDVTITGTGGASTGTGNIGINISSNTNTGYTFQGTGTVTLIGTGGGSGASSGNHGIFFGSTNIAFAAPLNLLGGVSCIMTGLGGAGTDGGHHGVSLTNNNVAGQNLFIDSNTSLTFLNCLGGTGGGTLAQGNIGVNFQMTGGPRVLNTDHIAVAFNNIQGGTSNVGAVTPGVNYGVFLYSLSLSGANSSITFSNITGGDVGVPASIDNYGLNIFGPTAGSTCLGAATITATNITGGGGATNNFGIALPSHDAVVGADPTYGLPVFVNLTGTGGGPSQGNGISNGTIGNPCTLSAQFGGTINLTGFGASTATTGHNSGIDISLNGINLSQNITTLEGATLNFTGVGGTGNTGNNMGASVVLNNPADTLTLTGGSTIRFTGCHGGNGAGAINYGVSFESLVPSANVTDDTTSQIVFENCTGGTGGGSNFGVLVDGLILNNASLLFTNITGGDAGANTSGNAGVVINGSSTVSAPIITATTNIVGGAAASNNSGFTVDGTLGSPTQTQNISITATGGNGTVNGNSGIFVSNGGLIQTGPSGSINLTGFGGTGLVSGGDNNIGIFVDNGGEVLIGDVGLLTLHGKGGTSQSTNHGIFFNTTSTLNAGNGGASTVSMTGVGGSSGSLGSGSESIGVLFQGNALIGSSSLSFLECKGGTTASNGGGNVGVYWKPSTFTAATNAAFFFDSITGGMDNGVVGGLGTNVGVEIGGAGIPFTPANSPSTISFSNITGGDAGKQTSDNSGVLIDLGTVVSASSITASTCTGGAAQSTNSGFAIGGTLGSVSFAQDINITAFGAGTGGSNFGILVDGTLETGFGGSITLNGIGSSVAGTFGQDHGILFNVNSNLIAAAGPHSNITLIGTGGQGTTAASNGVNFQGNIQLNNSSLTFLNCTGGTCPVGGNDGVLLIPGTFTAGSEATVSFYSIVGGASNLGGGGVNHGVGIGGAGIPLTIAPATITFSNIIGGDVSTNTSGNAAIFIDSGAIVSASNINATANITGGAAANNNYGFQINGTLGSATLAQNITITATGGASTTGTGNSGIYVNTGTPGGTIQTGPGGSITLTGIGNTSSSGGANHGIHFDSHSILLAGGVSASTITLTGIGGKGGVAVGSENIGVNIEADVTLNGGSLLYFLSCQGGDSAAGGNDGVFFQPTSLTAAPNAEISFNTISGGIGGGNNNGVEIGGVGIPFTAISSPSTITFTNITGGNNNTSSNNNGVFIDANATVSASNITTTGNNITGGSSLSTNYGFGIAGTLGSATDPQNIAITASGGVSTGGVNNIGIFVASNTGKVLTGPGGSITLIGTGNPELSSGGGNHGIHFQSNSSTLSAASGGTSNITLTGVGGQGTGINSGSSGVLFEGTASINSSSLFFSNCMGGKSTAGENIGVFLNSPMFTGTSGTVTFESIFGGISGGGGAGFNHAVLIGNAGLSLSGVNSLILFHDIQGGDNGFASPSNHGVFISAGTVSAGTITSSNNLIESGGGHNTNIGFYLSGGSTLGTPGVTQNINITAGSLGNGANEVGIQIDMDSKISVSGSATITLHGTTNLMGSPPQYGIVINDAASSISGGSGNITLSTPLTSILLSNGISISSTTGTILLLSNYDIVETGGATISTMGGPIELVVDNLNPAAVAVGNGVFNIPTLALSTTGGAPLQLYGAVENSGIFPATINGAAYVPGLFQAEPVYFPAGVFPPGDPYFVYYKNSVLICPPCPSGPTSPISINISNPINAFWIAIAEPFQDWRYDWYGEYLDDDRYPPAYTPHGMNIVLPSLVLINPRQQRYISYICKDTRMPFRKRCRTNPREKK